MPNWVTNNIEVTGNANDIQEFLEFVKSDENIFDFNKIIPQPESLNVDAGSSNSEDIYWYLSDKGTLSVDAVRKNPLSRIINGILIDPKWINTVAERIAEREEKPSYEMGKQLCGNYARYGAINWYDWRCKVWGTKWNAVDAYISNYKSGVHISFDTAWSMPDGIFEVLCEKFPNLEMQGEFADEDIGNNCGEWWNDNGEYRENYINTVEFACDVLGYDYEEDEY